MFAQMVKAHLESDFSERTAKKITPEQYLEWEKNYCFDGLRDLRPGQSFCLMFNITDHILFYNSLDPANISKYIKDTYIE
jgi:hypothetical protein